MKEIRARMMKTTAQILAAVKAVPSTPKNPKALAIKAIIRNKTAQRNIVNSSSIWSESLEKPMLAGAISGEHVSPNPIGEVDAHFMPGNSVEFRRAGNADSFPLVRVGTALLH
jgi:hypothetical protein